MGRAIFTVLFFVVCIVFRLAWSQQKKETVSSLRDIKVSIDQISVDKSIEKLIFKSISDGIEDYIDSITILNYEAFKSYWISQKYMEFSNRIEEEGLDWIGLVNKDLAKANVLSQIMVCLESKAVDFKLSEAFTDFIVAIYEECKCIEEENARYNNSFSKEDGSDPELHPIEPKIGASEEDEIAEKSIDDLLSTGTVEDVEE